MSAPTATIPIESGSRHSSLRAAVAAVLLSVVLLFVFDGLLFRTAFYRKLLQPDSTTGIFELVLQRELQAQKVNGPNLVVTLGDSRFAYAPRLANELTAKTGLVFRHAGIGGTEIRSWYYMLRDLDRTRRRYRAIVIGVANLSDEDTFFDPADDIRTLHYVIERLRWTDALDFAASFRSPSLKRQAFRGSILKGTVLQRDIYEFLSNPAARIRYVKQTRRGFDFWTYNYQETTDSMEGLRVDWRAKEAVFPPHVNEEQRRTVESEMGFNTEQTGDTAVYRRRWFGRIVDLYNGSPTRIIFVRLPRGPIPRPEDMAPKTTSAIRELAASRPNVTVIEEHAFDSLEHPELFRDGIHLNRAGIARFSPMLAEEVGRILAR
jgi:hypothetical protein